MSKVSNSQISQNNVLIQQNVKLSQTVRKLQNDMMALKKTILDLTTNRVPLSKVKDVCGAAIREIDLLNHHYNTDMKSYQSHARRGLLAIMALEQSDIVGGVNTQNKTDQEERSVASKILDTSTKQGLPLQNGSVNASKIPLSPSSKSKSAIQMRKTAFTK